MATAGALSQNIGMTKDIAGLAQALLGNNSRTKIDNTGFKQTQQTMLSQQAVDHLLRGLLEGTTGKQGLAQVSSGQRSAGMYNSTVNQQMINDLLSRSVAEVEARRSPTVMTQTGNDQIQTQKSGGLLSSPLGLGLGALAVGTEKGRKLLGIDKLLEGFGGGGDSIIQATGDAIPGISEIFPVDLGAGLGAETAALGIDQVGAMGGAMGGLGGALDGFGVLDIGGVGVPWLGGALNLLQGDVKGAVGSLGLGTLGFSLGGPVGGAIGSVVGGLLGDDCFITTAVCKASGLPDDCVTLTTLRNFRDTWLTENHPEDIAQYYEEAPAIVQKISARDDSTQIFSKFNHEYIGPAVLAIMSDNKEKAYQIYKSLFFYAKEVANG